MSPEQGHEERQLQLQRSLQELGVNESLARACSQLFKSVAQALVYVGADGGSAFRSPWQEYYSRRYQRFYYCNESTAENTWDIPPTVQLREWVLDADMYQVDITLACGAFKAVHLLLEGHWHNPDKLWQCMALLARLVGNVAGCQNSQEKFRQVRADNPKVRDQVLALAGAQGVLMAAGFQKSGDVFSYPAAATEQMLKLTGLVASKLQQLVAHKGFSGCAKPVDDEVAASGSSSASARMTPWHNTPGFRYQQDIHCCSLCAHPINDGSERLFTGAHDAPRGEFRYECQQCADPAVNLCEKCYDRLVDGAPLHTAGHTFRTFHPRASRHFSYNQETDGNPWGVALGRGGSAARARQRLAERVGM
ncbi:hypothetical protein V8C86DRAFT_2592931 [Haematococcus lacustris]